MRFEQALFLAVSNARKPMTTAIAKIKSRLANWRQWELNPVLVKELRQAVRNWTVTGALLMLLGVLFVATLGIVVIQSITGESEQVSGADVFRVYLFILAGTSFLFIPIYIGARLVGEREPANLDLLYATTLTPGAIIRGKFLSGAYMALLFFSACMPFMTFTYLLRGVDLPTIFLMLLFLYTFVCGAIMVAIFVACLPVSKVFKIGLALFAVWNGLMPIVPLMFFPWPHFGVGMTFGGPAFWLSFLTGAVIALAFWGLLYFASVALISPGSANRALPVRLYVTLIWVLGGATSLFRVYRQSNVELILPWAITTFFLMAPGLLVLVSQKDTLSRRVRRDIPAGGIKRALAFLFFNGAAGGLLWAMLILGLTFAVSNALLLSSPIWAGGRGSMSLEEANEFLVRSGAVLAYTLAYTLTGLFLHRKFFAKSTPKIAALLVVLILAATALLPYVVLFLLNQLSTESFTRLQLGNVFNIAGVENESHLRAHLTFAVVWFCAAAALNLKWFIAQVKNFYPIERAAVPTSQPPPEPLSAQA